MLRPFEPIEAMAWPHDDDLETLHAAVIDDGVVVATSTVHRQAPDPKYFPEPLCAQHALTAWRLRGMATDPAKRGLGYGASLVRACIDHARAHGGTLMWCTARLKAKPFYDRLGFTAHGPLFELPLIGPHYAMSITL